MSMASNASTAHRGEVTGEPSDGPAAQQEAAAAVAAAGRAAQAAAGQLRQMPAEGLDETLRAIAARLGERTAEVAAANADDVQAAKADGLADAFVDRLTLDAGRVAAMADQLRTLAEIGAEPARSSSVTCLTALSCRSGAALSASSARTSRPAPTSSSTSRPS